MKRTCTTRDTIESDKNKNKKRGTKIKKMDIRQNGHSVVNEYSNSAKQEREKKHSEYARMKIEVNKKVNREQMLSRTVKRERKRRL